MTREHANDHVKVALHVVGGVSFMLVKGMVTKEGKEYLIFSSKILEAVQENMEAVVAENFVPAGKDVKKEEKEKEIAAEEERARDDAKIAEYLKTVIGQNQNNRKCGQDTDRDLEWGLDDEEEDEDGMW